MAIPALTPTLLHADSTLPTLVVGPSLGTAALQLWGPAVPYLKNNFQIVGWDLPGHGASAPSTEPFTMSELAGGVLQLLENLATDEVISADAPLYYAGVSVGGAIALQLAHDAPGKFKGLSTICSAAKIGTAEAWTERAELVAKAGTPTMVTGSAQRWFAPHFIEENPVVSTDLLHNLQEADRFAYAHVCGALAGFDLRESLGQLSDPIISINGAHDTVCPPADAEFIAERVQRGEAKVVAKAAHLASAEDPETTANLLINFFTPAT